MKYKDVINFTPIETIVQIKEADNTKKAEKLVETFVISDRMAEKLSDIVFSHLPFQSPGDNKGLLIVGNYGTGKSHLMSVISAIAERSSILDFVQNKKVKEEASQIAGKFKVYRTEIGATKMQLREVLTKGIENYLESIGVDYSFPPLSEVSNNKDCLLEMMAEFEEQYPDQGLLIVVDELLDYLRTRTEQELILDLNFLREVGEVCKSSRFRFIAGVQESLFDNPRFQFVADTVRRVKDRFEQLRIAREDVSYVVANRLLKKDERQKSLVHSHLEKFSALYKNMAEKMDDYVNLFPVHPSYIDVFERVYIAEKREVLKTISNTIKKIIDKEIPEDQPGLIAYDSYWEVIKDNPSFRSIPEIREVLDKSLRLEGIINTSFTTTVYKPTAIRIIHALSVHRLTTGDLNSPIGVTAEGLRDDLTLYLPIPEEDEDFLKTTIESILAEIKKTVSGQFISYNKENEQYYLDLKKDVDYDAKIEEKADTLDDDKLNTHYYDILTWTLETAENIQYGSYRIWQYEIEWKEKRTTRLGWLFFGAPNERTTAQPPRDFYLYFLKPFGEHYFEDEKKSDEVFFKLSRPDDDFKELLMFYAASVEMASISSAESKRVYQEKSSQYRKQVKKWLDTNLTSSFDITYQGVTKKFVEWIKGYNGHQENIKEIVNTAASNCLSTHFKEQTPDYPTFSILTTSKNRSQYAQDALRWMATNIKTDTGAKILDALELLDGNVLKPNQSRYAKYITNILSKKEHKQVVSRNELIVDIEGVEYSREYRLEPEWVVVLLGALIHSGDITLDIHGTVLDASNIEELTKKPLRDLIEFKHISKPKDLPLAELQLLFEFFDLPRGLVTNPGTREEGVEKLQKKIQENLYKLVEMLPITNNTIQSFGVLLLQEPEREKYKKKLDEYKSFLESLQAYNTTGKLKNFKYSKKDIQSMENAKKILSALKDLLILKEEMDPLASYLSQAEMALPEGHSWFKELKESRHAISSSLEKGELDVETNKEVILKLKELKKKYIEEYIELHKKVRLDAKGDEKKKKLMQSEKLKRLNKLKDISLMPGNLLNEFNNQLGSLRTCYQLTKSDLEETPLCKNCSFNPFHEKEVKTVFGQLDNLEEKLDELYKNWTNTLLENLEDPMVKPNIDLITNKRARQRIEQFLAERELPEDLDAEFINAVQEVLQGLEKITFAMDEVKKAVLSGGSPCTIDELKKRFEKHIESQIKGKDPTKIRIILE